MTTTKRSYFGRPSSRELFLECVLPARLQACVGFMEAVIDEVQKKNLDFDPELMSEMLNEVDMNELMLHAMFRKGVGNPLHDSTDTTNTLTG